MSETIHVALTFQQLMERAWTAVSKLESQVARDKSLPPVYATIVIEGFDALREIQRRFEARAK